MPLIYTPPARSSLNRLSLNGLGVGPALAVSVIGVTTAISALAAIIQNNLDDDWTDSSVFNANMRTIHAGMLAVQCVVGGAQDGSPLVDTLGHTVCPGGTKPLCTLPPGQLAQWQVLRDGFSKFWADVSSSYFSPSNADAAQAKQYAQNFYNFYTQVQQTCRTQGVSTNVLPNTPAPPKPNDPNEAPGWVKYAVWGIGGVAVIALAVAAKSIFGKH